MKIRCKFILFLLILGNFIGIKEVKANELIDEFNEKLVFYLKEDGNEKARVNISRNENGEEIFVLTLGDSYETYTRSYVYKHGIITFDFKYNDLLNDWLEKEKYDATDSAIIMASEKALCDIKGYNYDDYNQWSWSLGYEQSLNLNIEQDGIYLKREELTCQGLSTEVISEYSIDLVNGFKSYESSSTDKVLDNKKVQEENIEDKEEKNTNKFNLKYIGVVLLLLIGIIEIGIILFYLVKKKKQ